MLTTCAELGVALTAPARPLVNVAGVTTVMSEEPSAAEPSRFDGWYGTIYDAVIDSPLTRALARARNNHAVLGRLNDLVSWFADTLPRHALVLDTPCGSGVMTSIAVGRRPDLNFIGCDLSPSMLQRAANRADRAPGQCALVHGDATELPFTGETFAAILSINGLHCIPNWQAYLHELARVAQADARMLLTTMVNAGGQLDELARRGFRELGVIPDQPPSVEDLRNELAAAGWTIDRWLGGTSLIATSLTKSR